MVTLLIVIIAECKQVATEITKSFPEFRKPFNIKAAPGINVENVSPPALDKSFSKANINQPFSSYT